MLLVGALLQHASSHAQGVSQPETGPAGVTGLPVAPSTDAQTQSKRAVEIVPRVEGQITATTNATRKAGGPSATYLETGPGVRVTTRSARLDSHIDYSLRTSTQEAEGGRRKIQQNLNAFGRYTGWDGRFALDATSTISSQAISAFGPQVGAGLGDSLGNANATQVRTMRLTPSLSGLIAGDWPFKVQMGYGLTHSDQAQSSKQATSDGSFSLGSNQDRAAAWQVSGQRQLASYSTGRDVAATQLRGLVTYRPDFDWQVGLIAGRETNNFASSDAVDRTTLGFQARWQPSPRTSMSAEFERRFFGTAHRVDIAYRTPRSVWRLQSSRDVNLSLAQAASSAGSIGRVYDLFYAQLAAIEPDPIARSALVYAYLASVGLSPDQQVVGGFLSNRPTLTRRTELSWALVGVRNSVTFQLSRGGTSRLAFDGTESGDLASTGAVMQSGYSITFLHKLSADTSFAVSAARQTSSASTTGQESQTRSINLNVTSRVSEKTTATVGARRVTADGQANSYSETAITGQISLRF